MSVSSLGRRSQRSGRKDSGSGEKMVGLRPVMYGLMPIAVRGGRTVPLGRGRPEAGV